MILIADSGSTKTDWAILRDGVETSFFRSKGYNPNFITEDDFRKDLRKSLPEGFDVSDVKEIFFYGAGVGVKDRPLTEKALEAIFPKAAIFAASDLLAAARALLGDRPGFAAILGTGMNTGIYDGRGIMTHVGSLGFILGDEGSGAYIGKMLLRDYARGNMPPGIFEAVRTMTGKSAEEIILQVYRKPKANRYCAQFSKWVSDNKGTLPYCEMLIRNAFRDFFRNVVSLYPDYRKFTLNCIGSTGYHNRDILSEVAEEFGMTPGTFIKSPIDGLVRYHRESLR